MNLEVYVQKYQIMGYFTNLESGDYPMAMEVFSATFTLKYIDICFLFVGIGCQGGGTCEGKRWESDKGTWTSKRWKDSNCFY